MAGNAHRHRQRVNPSPVHRANCQFCDPLFAGRARNTNGHRRNPSRSKRQRKRSQKFKMLG